MNASNNTTRLEKENLEVHVDLCAMRYDQLQDRFENVDERLDRLEHKIEAIRDEIRNGNASMTKVMLGTAGTIVAGIISTVIILMIGN